MCALVTQYDLEYWVTKAHVSKSPEVPKILQIREPKNHVDGVCKCEVLWLNNS